MANKHLNKVNDAPFEWLTTFESMQPFVQPSNVVFGSSSNSKASSSWSSTTASTSVSTLLDSNDDSSSSVALHALHVGSGTSTVGESLLSQKEFLTAEHDNGHSVIHRMFYEHVVNVDIDKKALAKMEQRWKSIKNFSGGGRIEWKHVDFQREETCRLALDPLYSFQTPHQSSSNLDVLSSTSTPVITSIQSDPINDSTEELGGYFDLVLDKSTLDCLLCSETDTITGLLCEAYRALRAPTSKTNSSRQGKLSHDWGGIYVLITFHHIQFINSLLTLPGADWDVEHHVVKRTIESVGDSLPNNTCCACELSKEEISETSGIFETDQGYRNTVNVFVCRRTRCSKNRLSFVLNRDHVHHHVETCCNEWYQRTHPMVTIQREEELRRAFLEAERKICLLRLSSSNISEPVGDEKEDDDIPAVLLLDLQQSYDVMFTDAEKEQLTYEYFLQDWEAFCDRYHLSCSTGVDIDGSLMWNRHGMTVDVALNFLREMQ